MLLEQDIIACVGMVGGAGGRGRVPDPATWEQMH